MKLENAATCQPNGTRRFGILKKTVEYSRQPCCRRRMKKTLRNRAIAAAGAVAALVLSSCVYDPYYSSAGGSYSSGYGDGYGYGGSNFSTSLFVSTGNSRWGYDPHCYSYYDYNRRCYYDPYLNGYYPVGYRPPVVYGVPHPHGYGGGYCPPPRYYSNVTVVNYRNREAAYRNTNYGWANQVRQQPSRPRIEDQHPTRSGSYYSGPNNSNSSNYRKDQYTPRTQQGSSSQSNGNRYSQSVKPGVREQQGSRLPQSYNTPVTRKQTTKNPSGRQEGSARNQPRQPQQPNYNRGGNQKRQEESKPSKEGKNKLRSLGQG
jgi:hypothetical protein